MIISFTHYQTTKFDSSKLKQNADNILKCVNYTHKINVSYRKNITVTHKSNEHNISLTNIIKHMKEEALTYIQQYMYSQIFVDPFPNHKFQTLSVSNLMKMAESPPNR